jgi:preprotein translocase subunit SecA
MLDRIWQRQRQPRRGDYELVDRIRDRADQLSQLPNDQVRSSFQTLKEAVQTAHLAILDHTTIVESFALTTDALRRTSGKIYYDVQLLGGLVLASGGIAEMQTGEGKTITCGLPSALYGLTGKGVHVATTNAYLAARDHEEMLPVFDFLGLSSDLVFSEQDFPAKRAAYQKDITFGTGYEFGFDFLRDQLAMRNRPHQKLGSRFITTLRGLPSAVARTMQRPLHFAIVDEADSVLIDEAATPLILSGGKNGVAADRQLYLWAMQIAENLTETTHFEIDSVKESISINDTGWTTIHQYLPSDIQARLQRPWSLYVEQALRAKHFFTRDTDYVVNDGEIVIVDQNTGRLHEDRKWRSGLHQAVEVREGCHLTDEREIEARITRQRYFKFYDTVAGMTGTATGNEAELLEFYQLPVVKIPRNKPSLRKTVPARYFADATSKYLAIAEDATIRSLTGQPVLIGTRTINQSREISSLLRAKKVEHVILNGVQDLSESLVIGQAGQPGRITIATNMAGRGTDIKMSDDAKLAGGLHVAVVEHQQSPRVDRQLIGRSARQSDPGSCQFFVCAEDEIIQRYEPSLGEAMQKSAQRHNNKGECDRRFDKEIQLLQQRIERLNFEARRSMVIHDNWIESVQETVAKLA